MTTSAERYHWLLPQSWKSANDFHVQQFVARNHLHHVGFVSCTALYEASLRFLLSEVCFRMILVERPAGRRLQQSRFDGAKFLMFVRNTWEKHGRKYRWKRNNPCRRWAQNFEWRRWHHVGKNKAVSNSLAVMQGQQTTFDKSWDKQHFNCAKTALQQCLWTPPLQAISPARTLRFSEILFTASITKPRPTFQIRACPKRTWTGVFDCVWPWNGVELRTEIKIQWIQCSPRGNYDENAKNYIALGHLRISMDKLANMLMNWHALWTSPLHVGSELGTVHALVCNCYIMGCSSGSSLHYFQTTSILQSKMRTMHDTTSWTRASNVVPRQNALSFEWL